MGDVYILPANSQSASYKMRVALDDKEYVLKVDWNTRLERWHMSLFDSANTALIMGLPLNVDIDLLSRFKGAKFPQGLMTLYDATGQHIECGREDLGVRCFLLYRSAS